MQLFRKVIGFWCLLGLLAACTHKEPVRIGFIGGMSGRVADWGGWPYWCHAAIEQRNAAVAFMGDSGAGGKG